MIPPTDTSARLPEVTSAPIADASAALKTAPGALSSRRMDLADAALLGAVALYVLVFGGEVLSKLPGRIRLWTEWSKECLGLSPWRIHPLINRRAVPIYIAYHVLDTVVEILVPICVALTLAVLLMRMRRPRPPIGRIARQPGFLGLAGALVGFWIPVYGRYFVEQTYPLAMIIGAVVATVWLGLAASRRWASERSWIDEFGRVVCLGWMLAGLISLWEFFH
jgi:hypothetical protein